MEPVTEEKIVVQLTGNKSNLPEDLDAALPQLKKDSLIVWSRVDPGLPICRAIWCQSLCPFVAVPYFWPYLICLCCPLGVKACYKKTQVLHHHVVVTDSSIEYVDLPHDLCCFPGCYVKSLVITSTPLDSVESVSIEYKDKGCLCCVPDFPNLRVMDGTMTKGTREHPSAHIGTVLLGYANVEGIRDGIEVAKSKRKPEKSAVQGVVAGLGASQIGHGLPQIGDGDPSLEPDEMGGQVRTKKEQATLKERLEDLKQIFDSGLITQDEYEKTKSKVLAAI